MRFRIEDWMAKVIDGAVNEPVVVTRRAAGVKPHNHDWYSVGENHREEGGWFYRDTTRDQWYIEVNTLDEFIEVLDKIQPVGVDTHDMVLYSVDY